MKYYNFREKREPHRGQELGGIIGDNNNIRNNIYIYIAGSITPKLERGCPYPAVGSQNNLE